MQLADCLSLMKFSKKGKLKVTQSFTTNVTTALLHGTLTLPKHLLITLLFWKMPVKIVWAVVRGSRGHAPGVAMGSVACSGGLTIVMVAMELWVFRARATSVSKQDYPESRKKQKNSAITIFSVKNIDSNVSTEIASAKAPCVFSRKDQTNSKTASIPEMTKSTTMKITLRAMMAKGTKLVTIIIDCSWFS